MRDYFGLAIGIILSICFLCFLFFYSGKVAKNDVNSVKVPSQSKSVPSQTKSTVTTRFQSVNVSPQTIKPAKVPSQSGNVSPQAIKPVKVPSQSGNVSPQALNTAKVPFLSGDRPVSLAYAEEFPSQNDVRRSNPSPARKEMSHSDKNQFPKEMKQYDEQNRTVHAIGVYHGDFSESDIRTRGAHREGIIDVTIKNNPAASPVTLILMSYESVEWRIRTEAGAKVEKIILSSYLPSRVTGIENVPVLREYFGFAYERRSLNKVNLKIREITGSEIKTFQGGYRGKYFDVY